MMDKIVLEYTDRRYSIIGVPARNLKKSDIKNLVGGDWGETQKSVVSFLISTGLYSKPDSEEKTNGVN